MKLSPFAQAVRWFVDKMIAFSYLQLACIYGGTIIVFGFMYLALFLWDPMHAPSLPGQTVPLKLINSIYFSAVTALSVGYGDIVPHGISKILAGTESFIALFIFGFLVAKPISERQEAAVYQMHKLTLDDSFSSIREGFYIMRRDFDSAMSDFRSSGTLSDYETDNLVTAFKLGEILLRDIPLFYDTKDALYRIDKRRESLLAEGVERTLQRLQYTIHTLGTLPPDAATALASLRKLSIEMIREWKQHSSDDIDQTLGRIEGILRKL